MKNEERFYLILFSSILFCAAIVLIFGKNDFVSLDRFSTILITCLTYVTINHTSFKVPLIRGREAPRFCIEKAFLFWVIMWAGISGAAMLCLARLTYCAVTLNVNTSRKTNEITNEILKAIVALLTAASFSILYINLKNVLFNTDKENALLSIFVISIINYLITDLLQRLPERFSYDNENYASILDNLFNFACAILIEELFRFLDQNFLIFLLLSIILSKLVLLERKYRSKLRRNERSKETYYKLVEALSNAIDARDHENFGHLKRVQIYALGLADILNLSHSEKEAIKLGALLHDIGKLSVPEYILKKTSRLTPSEEERIKNAPLVTASILEQVPFDIPVVETVKHIYERWDGKGYPDGLQRQEIPLTSRILAIANAYDAITSDRPFRLAFSHEKARQFLLFNAGRMFDPQLVDLFLRNLPSFKAQIENEMDNVTKTNGTLDTTLDAQLQKISSASQENFALHEIARISTKFSNFNLNDTLSLIADRVWKLIPFDTCIICLIDKEGSATIVYATGKNKEKLEGKKIKIGIGVTGFVLREGQAVVNADPAEDFLLFDLDPTDYKTMMAFPIIPKNKEVLGTLSFYSTQIELYDKDHERIAQALLETISEIMAQRLHLMETENKALTDPMTGLPNARALEKHIGIKITAAQQNNSEFHVLMLDLDGFKNVNDSFGHKVGDAVLCQISQLLRQQLRETDFLARYAGDEFIIVTADISLEEARILAKRIEESIYKYSLPLGHGKEAKVGISIGIASFPRDGDSIDQLIITADQAMYSVKKMHKQTQRLILETQSLIELDENSLIA